MMYRRTKNESVNVTYITDPVGNVISPVQWKMKQLFKGQKSTAGLQDVNMWLDVIGSSSVVNFWPFWP